MVTSHLLIDELVECFSLHDDETATFSVVGDNGAYIFAKVIVMKSHISLFVLQHEVPSGHILGEWLSTETMLEQGRMIDSFIQMLPMDHYIITSSNACRK